MRPRTLSEPLQSEATSDLRHLRLRERFALLDRLLHAAQNNFLEKLYVIRIDNRLVDLDRNHFAGAIRHYFHFSAARAYFDGFLLQLGLCLRHLLLHLLRLFHQLVEIHRSIFGSGFYLTFENLERFLDEQIIFKFFGFARRLLARTLARQSFFRAQFRRPIAATDFLEQDFELPAIACRGQRFNRRFLIRRITEKEIPPFGAEHGQRINQRPQKSSRRNLRTNLLPDFIWIDNHIRFRGPVLRRL